MPIYEYEAILARASCQICRDGFEIYQGIHEERMTSCPKCGNRIRRLISWCRTLVVETSAWRASEERQIRDYEKNGMWSHAAELADKISEDTGDRDLKSRALEDYSRAGYDADRLARQAGLGDD